MTHKFSQSCSGPLHVHLVSGPDNLEWSSIRHTSLCAEILHVDGIVRYPTFQGSLGHLSGCLLGLCVPLPQLPHDLRKAVTVLGIWFAHLHLFRTPRKSQVTSTATGSSKVSQSSKQASSLVTLLLARQSSVSVLLKRLLVSISDTDTW